MCTVVRHAHKIEVEIENKPDTDEIDLDTPRKRKLEQAALVAVTTVIAQVHLVCEGDMLVVIRRQKANFVQHPRECPCDVSAAREPE